MATAPVDTGMSALAGPGAGLLVALLGVLLPAVGVHRTALGLAMIVAFGAGLAMAVGGVSSLAAR